MRDGVIPTRNIGYCQSYILISSVTACSPEESSRMRAVRGVARGGAELLVTARRPRPAVRRLPRALERRADRGRPARPAGGLRASRPQARQRTRPSLANRCEVGAVRARRGHRRDDDPEAGRGLGVDRRRGRRHRGHRQGARPLPGHGGARRARQLRGRRATGPPTASRSPTSTRSSPATTSSSAPRRLVRLHRDPAPRSSRRPRSTSSTPVPGQPNGVRQPGAHHPGHLPPALGLERAAHRHRAPDREPHRRPGPARPRGELRSDVRRTVARAARAGLGPGPAAARRASSP